MKKPSCHYCLLPTRSMYVVPSTRLEFGELIWNSIFFQGFASSILLFLATVQFSPHHFHYPIIHHLRVRFLIKSSKFAPPVYGVINFSLQTCHLENEQRRLQQVGKNFRTIFRFCIAIIDYEKWFLSFVIAFG